MGKSPSVGTLECATAGHQPDHDLYSTGSWCKWKSNLPVTCILEQYKRILNDYPIFMAIAEDIGYDATGKETKGNELPAISEELVKFIKAIEEGNDRFFQ